MTLLEALQDIGKGRIIDNGCEYELIALAKGAYTFTLANGAQIEIKTAGKQGENAAQLVREYREKAQRIAHGAYYNSIIKAEYKRQ